DVGIAMGKGTDTALETADAALMGNDIRLLPFTVDLSRRTLRIIKANITFSLVIKLIALLLVIPGWLTLWIAILLDIGATLIVSLNRMMLLIVKKCSIKNHIDGFLNEAVPVIFILFFYVCLHDMDFTDYLFFHFNHLEHKTLFCQSIS